VLNFNTIVRAMCCVKDLTLAKSIVQMLKTLAKLLALPYRGF